MSTPQTKLPYNSALVAEGTFANLDAPALLCTGETAFSLGLHTSSMTIEKKFAVPCFPEGEKGLDWKLAEPGTEGSFEVITLRPEDPKNLSKSTTCRELLEKVNELSFPEIPLLIEGVDGHCLSGIRVMNDKNAMLLSENFWLVDWDKSTTYQDDERMYSDGSFPQPTEDHSSIYPISWVRKAYI